MSRSFVLSRGLPLAVLAAAIGMLLATISAPAGVAAQTEPSPGPAPRDCAGACGERAKAYYEKCVAEHGDEEGCRARADRLQADCVASCDKPADPRPPSISPRLPRDCAGACNERAKTFYTQCVEEHGDEAGCAARARAHLSACLASCDRPVEPKPIDCDTTCRRHAEEVLRKCEAAGGENCAARARAAHASCMARCDRPADPRPIDCETECSRRARALHQRCTASGGENCAERAKAALAECMAACDTSSVRPSPRPGTPREPGEPGEPPVRPRP